MCVCLNCSCTLTSSRSSSVLCDVTMVVYCTCTCKDRGTVGGKSLVWRLSWQCWCSRSCLPAPVTCCMFMCPFGSSLTEVDCVCGRKGASGKGVYNGIDRNVCHEESFLLFAILPTSAKAVCSVRKSIETSCGISVLWPIALLWESEALNPLECTQDHSTRDLGLLILKEMWWVKVLRRHHLSLRFFGHS